MNVNLNDILTPRVFLAILGLAVALLVITFAWIIWTAPPPPEPGNFLAAQTVIPAPTGTPLPPPTEPAGNQTPTPVSGEISIGGYVQISGTSGQGLRLRADAGLDAPQLFLGYDSEVFQVQDGPQFKDGYTWWYLVAIYDDKRSGWAADAFLGYIPAP